VQFGDEATMKLFLCFVLLFVAVRAQYEFGSGEEDKQDPFWPDFVPDENGSDDEGAIVIGERPTEGDDDDEDEPTTPSPTKTNDEVLNENLYSAIFFLHLLYVFRQAVFRNTPTNKL